MNLKMYRNHSRTQSTCPRSQPECIKNTSVLMSIAKFAEACHVATADHKQIVVVATHEVHVVQRLQSQFRRPQLFLKLSFIERALRCTDMGSHFSLSSIWKQGTQLDEKQITVAILIADFSKTFHVATVDSQKSPRCVVSKVGQKRVLIMACPQHIFKLLFIERAL